MKILRLILVLGLLNIFSSIGVTEGLPVTSEFGWRIHPISGTWKFHAGVDLGYEYGAAIPALFDGVVVQAGNLQDGYGQQVLLYHPSVDAYTRYAHCSALYVLDGDEVTAQQTIAAVGSSGYSTGPHLHLEYIIHTDNGYEYTNPLSLWSL